MTARELQRKSFKVSLAVHGILLLAILVVPWILQACQRNKPAEKLMFVEFTVSVPPPPAPETPEPPTPVPEPPKPPPKDDIPIPDKKPDPPAPRRDIRQTNRVVRRPAPPPRDKPPSEAEIARLLRQAARIGETTTMPTGANLQLGAYFNHVHERMYAAWNQPAELKSLPGLNTRVVITVKPDGTIIHRRLDGPSGNTLMDDSVMKAVQSVKALRPLPAGHTDNVDIDITFELAD